MLEYANMFYYLADIDVSEEDDSNRQHSVDTRDEVVVGTEKILYVIITSYDTKLTVWKK